MQKRQFKIAYKIAIGFGLLIVLIATIFVLTQNTLNEAENTNNKIAEVHSPSISNLKKLDETIESAYNNAKHIAYNQTKINDKERLTLITTISKRIPEALTVIEKNNINWGQEDKKTIKLIKVDAANLVDVCWTILDLLPNHSSYEEGNNQLVAMDSFEGNDSSIENSKENIHQYLDLVIISQENQLASAVTKMNNDFHRLNLTFILLVIITIIAGIIIAIIVIRSVTIPVQQLQNVMMQLSEGIYPTESIKAISQKQNNEIGDMALSVETLVAKLKKTKEFTLDVGSGNFNTEYEPLSEHDELGYALIKMRNDLANTERQLELKVTERTEEAVIERKKATRLYRNLADSIEYAKRIQQSFLTSPKNIIQLFPDAFVLYKPKDKVSGDFFWVKNMGDKRLIAAVDCTGHGVPGAFVSMVGNNVLNSVTKLFSKPAEILDILHVQSSELLRSGLDEGKLLMDGMDIALCMININTYELEFAGAYNSLIIIRKGELFELKADRFSIGSEQAYKNNYTNQTFQLEKGDSIYLFSDGYADQFGGPRNKKYFIKRFRSKLIEISQYDMQTQNHFLEDEFLRWKGTLDQTDDILVIGIQV